MLLHSVILLKFSPTVFEAFALAASKGAAWLVVFAFTSRLQGLEENAASIIQAAFSLQGYVHD